MKKQLFGTCAAAFLGLIAAGCKTSNPEKDALYASLPYEVPEESFFIKRCNIPIEVLEIKKIDEHTSTTNVVVKTVPYAKYTFPGVIVNICDKVWTELGFTLLKIKCDLDSVADEAENHPLQGNPAFKVTQGIGDGICWGANVIRFSAIELIKGFTDGIALGATTDLYTQREEDALLFYRKQRYNYYTTAKKGFDDYHPIERKIYTDKDNKILKIEVTDPYSDLTRDERRTKAKDLFEKNEEKGKERYENWSQKIDTPSKGNTNSKEASENDFSFAKPIIKSTNSVAIKAALNRKFERVYV